VLPAVAAAARAAYLFIQSNLKPVEIQRGNGEPRKLLPIPNSNSGFNILLWSYIF